MQMTVVEAFGDKLPFDDGEFDLVLARQVLHHARDLPQLCREMARVLREGGNVARNARACDFEQGRPA